MLLHTKTSQCSQLRPVGRSRTVHFTPACLHKEYSKPGTGPGPYPKPVLPSTPEDVLLELITLLRKPGDLSELAPFIPDHLLAPPGTPVLVAGVPVHEQGPLARCSPCMDTAARRVLPGHLLRRSRILSSLQLGGSSLLRVALTACTGEELVLNWRLGRTQLPNCGLLESNIVGFGSSSSGRGGGGGGGGGSSGSSSSGGTGATGQASQAAASDDGASALSGSNNAATASNSGTSTSSSSSTSSRSSTGSSSSSSSSKASWQVLSCERDTSNDDSSLPAGPHPRSAPELVVLAQLQALQQQQLMTAAAFNMLGRHASGSGWEAHLAAFKHLLSQPHYRLLSSHSMAQLGSSALPSQRHFLQEVLLWSKESDLHHDELYGSSADTVGGGGGGSSSSSSSNGGPGRFLWRLGMQADGCWMVRSIEVL